MFNVNLIIYIIVFYTFIVPINAYSVSKKCNNIKKNCNVLDKVVGIKTPMMIASGTIINDNLIITNRHVVEDHKQFIIKFNDGKIKKASPLAHNFPADLALLTLNKELEIIFLK
jgi:S1-C subfamily serine protease